jgi:uncharacterized protein (DUF433 family)
MNINTEFIWTNPERMSGSPCIRNHRLPISQLLWYLTESDLNTYCSDFQIDKKEVIGALKDLSDILNKHQ